MKLATLLPGLAALLLGVLSGPAEAAPEDYEGKPVLRIEFQPDDQPYPREYLNQILPVQVGRTLFLADVRAAIERLYGTGRYQDIDVDAHLEAGGVVLVFRTALSYFISQVTVERVPQPPSPAVLVNATRLDLGVLFTEEALRQAGRNVTDVLRQNGFYRTNVRYELTPKPDTQQMNIRFFIEHGDRARYRRPVITGAPPEDYSAIIDATKWKGWFGWKEVTQARTDDGVDRVRQWYHHRDRLEAEVSLEKLDYEPDTQRVTPSLNVAPGPKVRIRITGADVSRGRMRQLLPVFEEQSVDRDLLVEGQRNLRQYFESKGYFHTTVDFATENMDGGGASSEQLIDYKVALGERHKVVAVTIAGNKYFDEPTLRERMYIRPAGFLQFRHGRYSDSFLERDVEAIESLYRSNGFRDVEVVPRVEHGINDKHTNMAVHLDVHEGPQWLVARLEVRGVSEENSENVLGMIQSQQGQPFSEFNISIDRDNILEYYYNRGYPDAGFAYSYHPAKAPHQAELEYRITEGPRRFVRDVLVAGGLETTDEALVRERVSLEPGDPLSRSRMLDTQRRLYDLGIFARVDMALQNPQGDEANKYVLLDFEEARKWTVTGGVGAEVAKIGGCSECLDAPVGSTGFSPRVSFGVTRRNFLGNGHIISLQTRASTLQRRGVVTYNAPQFRGNEDVNLLFSALYDDSRDVRTFTARRREASVQIGQRLSRASTMLYRLTYRRVSLESGDRIKITDPVLIPQFLQPVRLGIIAGNYIQDRRDDPTDAHRGIYNTLDLGVASRALASQADFGRFIGHNATYHPIGLGSRYVLARALTFGFMERFGKREIPLPERFFGGGPASHRGFPYNQAGPRDPQTGFPLGGRAILINQVEFRYPLLGENMGGVAFLDSGNVYSGLNKLSLRFKQNGINDFDYMVHAVGLGLRYRTPVGPVRVDLAYSLNPPRFFGCKGTTEQLRLGCPERAEQQIGHFQFHFSLGQAF